MSSWSCSSWSKSLGLLQSLSKPQPERKEDNFYTNRRLEIPSGSQRERERESSHTGLPGVLDLTAGSGEMQSFNGHLSHFPTLPPLLLGVLQNTFAIAITSSSWSLQNKSPPTTHHPPLPNNKSNDGQTNTTNNTTSWSSFFPRTLPLPKRVKEPSKQQDLQQSEK